MGPITITVHESVPVTVQAELLRQLKVKPGDRLEWRVDGSELVLRRVRSLDSLRGCLASTVPFPGLEAEKAAARSVGYSKVLRFCANVRGRQLYWNRLDGPGK
jgi:bifunctional DNA-binding transcriptional regulator/antitoxin component of YhaV-PrlF toxin-antitoxin module